MSSSGKQRLRHSDIRKDRKELLLAVEKAHKVDIQTYTLGHLGPRSLTLRPLQCKKEQPHWETSKYPNKNSVHKTPLQKSRTIKETVEEMTDDFSSFVIATPVRGPKIHNSASSLWPHQLNEILDPTEGFFEKSSCIEQEPAEDDLGCHFFKEPYITGVTFEDQLKLRWQFDSLKTRTLSARRCISGRDVAERHECKLEQKLRKIPKCKAPCVERLAVVSEIFDDVCEGSPAFGSILREIKTEYDLYVKSVFSSHAPLQDQHVFTTFGTSIASVELEAAAKQVSCLEDEARTALEDNDRVRTKYEDTQDKPTGYQNEEVWRSENLDPAQSDPAVSEKEPFLDMKMETSKMSSAAQVEANRRQIWKLLKEVQGLQKEIRETMVSTVTVGTLEDCITDTKAKITRLTASNEHLRSANKDLEQKFLMMLNRAQVSEETKAQIWEKILVTLTRDNRTFI